MSVDNEEVGDRVADEANRPAEWTSRDYLDTQSLSTDWSFPLSIRRGIFAGEVGSAFLERRNGGEKKKIEKRKKFSWDSDWIDLGKRDFASAIDLHYKGATEKRDIFRGMSFREETQCKHMEDFRGGVV